ncbi:S-layer homology domain-containing protein [Solibacillus sp. FSL R7-0668]|uniref:S-layer homology domain-containing protein n=1 Tax=Solibacillus sp. FSL R7-0668 TaxID=2921688 RepID=UPI0030FB0B8E
MESKKAQKLSKATVATVLAASGVIVAMPQSSSASTFSDVSQYSDYYEPIVDLVNRKIVSGYPDGTFRPNKSITREEAAKMLARTIDVNITNPANPGFKDVRTSDPNYRYIAALASEGIINGYPDGKFHPKEPITRAQMAKILSLGFKLGISTKLNHGFKDVPSNNPNAYFIQTLYDLNITKGVTAIKFDPFNTVTRAQMATFIWRAEKADRGTPVYEVGDIIGDQIYINGVAHTIASHLRSILNASNKNMLKGAYIEGDFTGNKINNMTKLTINASGTSSRLLAMDGDYTSFAGELVVNGSYLRFKNINFTGRVEIAEAPRRSLAEFAGVRVAGISTFAGFIDWTPPTSNGDDGSLNPDEDETLVDKPDPSKPETKYKDRMPNLKKYVDFESAELRQVYVTANHAFLKADSDIDRLYVQGEISNFELYANANAMYVDTDFNTTIYGSHDIKYAYKNSLKNVYLRSDATYDYYYVTAGNGYTNLGEFAYISNAVIPVKETVNDVFDDFETDEPNIGYIEDEDGKEVSRDPVGDNEVSDKTQPIITQLDVKAGGTVADVTMTANEDGTYYYVVRPSSEKAPSISEIKTGGFKFNGSGPITMDEQVKFQVTGLETKTEYTIYAIVIDDADNVSEKKSVDFTTIDNSPPRFTLQPGAKQPGGKRFEVKFTRISEPGTIYYYVRQKGSSGVDPTFEDIMKKYTGTVLVTKPEDLPEMIRQVGADPNKSAVLPNTTYEVFAIMVDKTDNRSNLVEKIEVKTEAPDTTHPYVNNTELVLEGNTVSNDGYFYLTVNEELDKESAENIDNYVLSGTGIVNISGQKEIKPSEVVYSNKRIRLKIPSVTALVNGDTIRVTVLPGVKDLAENPFESTETAPNGNPPRNYAIYNHLDPLAPTLKIDKVENSPTDNKFLVNVITNKAGTYYYMILENGYFDREGKNGITPRDFVDEFDSETITGKFDTDTKKDYLAKGSGSAELGKIKLPPISRPDGVSEFKDYSIYILLKDRSGKISIWDQKTLITDTKPPLTKEYKIESPKTGTDKYKNETASITFNADEAGTLHVAAIPKYKKDVPPNNKNYIWNKDSAGNSYFDTTTGKLNTNRSDISVIYDMMYDNATRLKNFKDFAQKAGKYVDKGYEAGNPTVDIEGLDPHMEYMFLMGVEDTYGNFTIRQLSDNPPPISSDEPNGALIVKDFYTDGVQPHIAKDGIIVREGQLDNADSTFTITFNEAIMRQNGISNPANFNKPLDKSEIKLEDILTIAGDAGDITSKFIVENYIYEADTTKSSKLIIKAKDGLNTANTTFNVTMKANKEKAYDYVNHNTFDISKIGKYIYRVLSSDFTEITQVGPGLTPSSSYKVIAVFDLTSTDPNFAINENLTYYYASYSKAMQSYVMGLTPDKIVDIANSSVAIDQALNRGKGTVLATGGRANIPLEHSTGFYKDDYIVIVLEDKYGNRLHGYQKVGYSRP